MAHNPMVWHKLKLYFTTAFVYVNLLLLRPVKGQGQGLFLVHVTTVFALKFTVVSGSFCLKVT